jgi:hypothetical protein
MTSPDDFADLLQSALNYKPSMKKKSETRVQLSSTSSSANDSDSESEEDSQKLMSDDSASVSDSESSEFKTEESESTESSDDKDEEEEEEESVQPKKKAKKTEESEEPEKEEPAKKSSKKKMDVDSAEKEKKNQADSKKEEKKKESSKKEEKKTETPKKEEKKTENPKKEEISKKEEKKTNDSKKEEKVESKNSKQKIEEKKPNEQKKETTLLIARPPASPITAAIIEQAIIQKAQMPRAVLKLETVARFMAKSITHTQLVLSSLLLAYNKSAKLAELSASALAARQEDCLVLAFDASSKKKRIAAIRENFVQGLQQQNIPVPPCTATEDALLSSKEITNADFSDDEKMTDDSRQTRKKTLEVLRAEAKKLNDERKEAFDKLEPHERAKIEITGLEYLREKMLSHVKAKDLLPYLPAAELDNNFDNATVATIFHNTQKRACAAFLLGKEDYDSFYSPYVMQRYLSQRLDSMPLDVIPGAGIVDLLSLGYYLSQKLTHELGKTTKNPADAAKLVEALGEALYFNDNVETKEALLTRIFCWSPPSEWLECVENPVWLEVHKTLPDRVVMRKGSRSVKPLFECVQNCAADKIEIANTVAPNFDEPDEQLKFTEKKKKQPPQSAAAKQEPAPITVVAPTPEAVKPAVVPESASEARIDARLFFVSPHAPDSKFDKFQSNKELVDTEKMLADIAPIRSKEAASKFFSIMTQEANTTSAQMAIDGEVKNTDNVDSLVQTDLRRIEVLARRANVSELAIRNEIARVTDPEAFARLVEDFPDLMTLSERDLQNTIAEAKKLREETRDRTNTTKKSALNQVSQRVHKPADGLLTRVEAPVHKNENASAKDNGALGETTSSHTWLNNKIVTSAVNRQAAMPNSDLVMIAEQLLKGGEFCIEQRMLVVEFRAQFAAMCKYTIAEMHKRGKVFCSAQDNVLLEHPSRLLRKTTSTNEFVQWMAHICVMANSLDILYELATCTVDKAEAAEKLALIKHLPVKDFSPLVAWKN